MSNSSTIRGDGTKTSCSEGYPAFSQWMSNDDDFFVMRKFEKESVRIALWMQDRVSQSSAELDRIDEYYKNEGAHCGRFRSSSPDQDARLQVLARMSGELKRYRQF